MFSKPPLKTYQRKNPIKPVYQRLPLHPTSYNRIHDRKPTIRKDEQELGDRYLENDPFDTTFDRLLKETRELPSPVAQNINDSWYSSSDDSFSAVKSSPKVPIDDQKALSVAKTQPGSWVTKLRKCKKSNMVVVEGSLTKRPKAVKTRKATNKLESKRPSRKQMKDKNVDTDSSSLVNKYDNLYRDVVTQREKAVGSVQKQKLQIIKEHEEAASDNIVDNVKLQEPYRTCIDNSCTNSGLVQSEIKEGVDRELICNDTMNSSCVRKDMKNLQTAEYLKGNSISDCINVNYEIQNKFENNPLINYSNNRRIEVKPCSVMLDRYVKRKSESNLETVNEMLLCNDVEQFDKIENEPVKLPCNTSRGNEFHSEKNSFVDVSQLDVQNSQSMDIKGVHLDSMEDNRRNTIKTGIPDTTSLNLPPKQKNQSVRLTAYNFKCSTPISKYVKCPKLVNYISPIIKSPTKECSETDLHEAMKRRAEVQVEQQCTDPIILKSNGVKKNLYTSCNFALEIKSSSENMVTSTVKDEPNCNGNNSIGNESESDVHVQNVSCELQPIVLDSKTLESPERISASVKRINRQNEIFNIDKQGTSELDRQLHLPEVYVNVERLDAKSYSKMLKTDIYSATPKATKKEILRISPSSTNQSLAIFDDTEQSWESAAMPIQFTKEVEKEYLPKTPLSYVVTRRIRNQRRSTTKRKSSNSFDDLAGQSTDPILQNTHCSKHTSDFNDSEVIAISQSDSANDLSSTSASEQMTDNLSLGRLKEVISVEKSSSLHEDEIDTSLQSPSNQTIDVQPDFEKMLKKFDITESYVLLDKLQDPIRVTQNRNIYQNWDLSSSLIPEIQKESSVEILKKQSFDGINADFSKRISLTPKNSPNLCRNSLNVYDITTRKTVFLKPGKFWARSLSILNNIHAGSNLETLCFGKGKNWRHSVQTILNMQQQGAIQSCVKKTEDDKELQSCYNVFVKPELVSPIKNDKKGISLSPNRLTKRLSIRVVPENKNFSSAQDISFLEAYGITTSKKRKTLCERLTLLPVHRETSVYDLQCKNVSIETSETELVVTAKDVVLQRCKQKDYLSFAQCFPETYLKHCRKIGEGVYGEVFLYKCQKERSVVKIIPIEGNELVNGEPQKKFNEILSEIIIAEELHNLRFNEKCNTCGFVEVKNIKCIIGKYPDKLVELWKMYDEEKASDNDCPSMFDESQLYIVLELGHGGQDLEAFVFQSAVQSLALFVQAAAALAVAERSLEFEHRDLHWGNILISNTNKSKIHYKLDDREIFLPTKGVQVAIIDFTLSRMFYQGCCIFNDLALDPALFTAQGEYQFEIYRLMRDRIENNWQKFEPYTNILWLHYTLDKMITAVRYKKKVTKVHKKAISQMQDLKDMILSYKSAFDFVTNCDKII